eukprot:scaffold283_cov316-Pavlova_lutheri.AAC.48
MRTGPRSCGQGQRPGPTKTNKALRRDPGEAWNEPVIGLSPARPGRRLDGASTRQLARKSIGMPCEKAPGRVGRVAHRHPWRDLRLPGGASPNAQRSHGCE